MAIARGLQDDVKVLVAVGARRLVGVLRLLVARRRLGLECACVGGRGSCRTMCSRSTGPMTAAGRRWTCRQGPMGWGPGVCASRTCGVAWGVRRGVPSGAAGAAKGGRGV